MSCKKEFKCSICCRLFKQEGWLIRHMNQEHEFLTNPKIISYDQFKDAHRAAYRMCNFCGAWKRQCDAREHVLICTIQKPLPPCPVEINVSVQPMYATMYGLTYMPGKK